MNVANILAYLAKRYGGPPRVALAMSKAMAPHNVKVSCWATRDEKDRQELGRYGSSVRLFETTWPRVWFRSPALIQTLSREIPSIDLLHLHEVWSYPQYAAARLARGKGTPYVLTPHGELGSWHVRSKGLKKFVYLASVGKRMFNGSACLHAITPIEIEGFRKVGYKGPVTVIPNGVNLDDFADMPAPSEAEKWWPQLSNRRIVLFLSRLSREKGLDQLLPAWANLTKNRKYDDALLVLAGPDDRGYSAEVEALVEKHNLGSNIILTGLIKGRQKAALISRADIYTLPSYSEGFSMSVLENLAAGKPVLITPGCNFPEVVQASAGFCVQPKLGPLEEGLRKLLDMSEDERTEMGRRGRDLVRRNYTWDIAARKMITVYRCILEGKEIPMYPKPAEI